MTTTKPPVLTDDEIEAITKAAYLGSKTREPQKDVYKLLAHIDHLKALLERAGADAWQPIETAPKQGMILLGRPAEGEGDDRSDAICTPGYWQEGWEDSIDDMGCNDGFVDSQYQIFSPPRTFGAEKCRSAGHQPTNWMPLPAGPGALKVTPAAAVADDEDIIADIIANHAFHDSEHGKAAMDKWQMRDAAKDILAHFAPQAGKLSGNAGEVDVSALLALLEEIANANSAQVAPVYANLARAAIAASKGAEP